MKKRSHLGQSFRYAFAGIYHCLRHERNIRIHFCIGVLVVLLGLLLRITPLEMAVICLTIGVVIGGEMINTAMENVIDLMSPQYHPLAKVVKDVVAGAVLIFCFFACLVGLFIFVPYLL